MKTPFPKTLIVTSNPLTSVYPMVSQFISRLDQIINGQIVLTPEIVNKDVYKTGQTTLGIISLVRLAVAIILVVLALKALIR